jgi:hypothetical protein
MFPIIVVVVCMGRMGQTHDDKFRDISHRKEIGARGGLLAEVEGQRLST